MVQRYLDIVYEREQLLLEFLVQPRTLVDIIKKRIVYRKDYDNVVWIDAVEKNSMQFHLEKLIQEGKVVQEGSSIALRERFSLLFSSD